MLSKVNKYLFIILPITLLITFFTRNNYRNVDEIHPEILKEPLQTQILSPEIETFTMDDYEYKVTKLYDYEIAGLVVHKLDYTWFSISKSDSVFPLDLCLIWGGNVKSKVYQSKNLTFSQDMRFCFYQWWGDLNFNPHELSNNHLLIKDDETKKKIDNILTGDQVRVKGQLVNVEARNLGSPGEFDPAYFKSDSSTTRTDTGAGACEIILATDVEILKKANPVSRYIFKSSLYGLIILVCLNIVVFFIQLIAKPLLEKIGQRK